MKYYPQIIDNTGIGAWEYNIQTGTIECDKNYAKIVGYPLSELQLFTIEKFTTLFEPKYIGKSNMLQDHFDGKTNRYKCEIRLKQPEGDYVWINAKGKVVSHTADGKPLLMVGSVQNITNYKRNQALLKRFEDVVEISNKVAITGYWEMDFLHNRFFWSPVVYEILKVDRDHTLNLSEWIGYFPFQHQRELLEKANNKAMEHGDNYDLELQIKTKKGDLIWVRLIGVAKFKNKKCIRVYGLIQDIDKIKKEQVATSIREEQFRQTFEHASIGMALVCLTGRLLLVNESICTILGYSKEELYKTTFKDLTHPEDFNKDLRLSNELIKGKRDNFTIEKRYLRKNGQTVWINLSVSLVRNDLGEPIHFVSQLQDITENKNLIETMQDQNKRLINFAYIVSHNLRSHTGNIQMLLDLIEAEGEGFEKNEFFTHLKTSSKNLNETVDHLNEVVVINTELNHNFVAANIYEYVENATASLKALVEISNCSIVNNVDKALYVSAVPAYLESIILNFITNAIKYRSPKRKSLIEISTGLNLKFVILKIKDNGLGIDMNLYGDKLFGMYKTFHNNEDSRGIGLFITKNQIEALGGKVIVESQVDIGSSFSIYFKKASKQVNKSVLKEIEEI